METVSAKLVAKECDTCGYVTYVFQLTDKEEQKALKSKLVMCVRFPNWEHRNIDIGNEGYLAYQEIRAGIDKWFNGKDMVPYRYNMIQFIKFVPKPPERHQCIL